MSFAIPLRIPGGRAVQGDVFTIGGDVNLVRSGANALALRNGTNPQTFIVNGTYTDAGNYRRGRLAVDAAGAVTLACEGLGTGATGNAFSLLVDGVAQLSWVSGGTTAVFGASLQIAPTSSFRFGSTRSRMLSPSDGTVNLTNAAGSGFTALQFAGTQVLTTRRTGWGLPTGTLTRTTFDPSTVTLAGLAERVAALITDCHSTAGHGFIGT